MHKMPEFYIFARKKYLFPILGAIPGCEAESKRTRPQLQPRDHGGHRSTGAIVLHKVFMRLCANVDQF